MSSVTVTPPVKSSPVKLVREPRLRGVVSVDQDDKSLGCVKRERARSGEVWFIASAYQTPKNGFGRDFTDDFRSLKDAVNFVTENGVAL